MGYYFVRAMDDRRLLQSFKAKRGQRIKRFGVQSRGGTVLVKLSRLIIENKNIKASFCGYLGIELTK